MKKHVLGWGLTLALSATVVIVVFVIPNLPNEESGYGYERYETVDFAEPRPVRYTPTVSVLGEIIAPGKVDLRNQVRGEVSFTNLQSGVHVDKGQTLLSLNSDEEAALLESLKVKLRLAKIEYERIFDLSQKDAVSITALDTAKAEVDSLSADILALENVIKKKSIFAPFSGTLGIVDLEVGQYLDANTYLTTLVADANYAWVDFFVPQHYPKMTMGASVDIVYKRLDVSSRKKASIAAQESSYSKRSRTLKYRARLEFDKQF